MSKFWVAGATGFLGSHLVKALVERGHGVVAVSKSGGSVHGLEVAAVDILNEAAVTESARGADGAFLVTGRVSRDRDDEALAGWFDPTGLPGYTGHVGRAILPPVTAT